MELALTIFVIEYSDIGKNNIFDSQETKQSIGCIVVLMVLDMNNVESIYKYYYYLSLNYLPKAINSF